MGMFNSIVADIPCPTTCLVSKGTEIQIKWQAREARMLDMYRVGDLLSEYDDTWIRTDYICKVCSPKTTGRNGIKYIGTQDQRWHIAFVEIRKGRLHRVVSESEFQQMGIDGFADDV